MILDLDENLLAECKSIQCDLALREGELEGVLQEVCQCGEQQFAASAKAQ